MTAAGNAKVMLVEDNPGDVELVRVAIGNCVPEGALRVFLDGQSAFEYVEGGSLTPSTLILLDLNLPGRNGFEILEAIQRAGTHDRIATVVLSSSTQPADRERALALGAASFMNKPGSLDEIDTLQTQLCAMISSLDPS